MTRMPPRTSTNMITQVVATAEVIGTGLIWKSGMLLSGEVMAFVPPKYTMTTETPNASHQVTASVTTAAHLPGSANVSTPPR